MEMASEILARAHEKMKGPLPEINDRSLVANFLLITHKPPRP
jgi:hypothetical protein